jgi:integrase/recombinase XerD
MEEWMRLKDALDGFLLDCQMRGRSPNTVGLYERLLRRVTTWLGEQGILGAEQVTIAHLRAFMVMLQGSVSGAVNPRRPAAKDGHTLMPETLRAYVKAIKVWFKWLTEEEVIDRNPALRLAKPQLPHKVVLTLSDKHLKALFETCDLRTSQGFRDYTIMLLLLDTGVRISELVGLALDDVHEGYLKVLGKGRKEREVGISAAASKFLWKYINKYREQANESVHAVFTNFGGHPLTAWGVEKIVRRAKEEAGITDIPVTAHKFRHTFARTWLERGGEVYSLSRLMGHSSVKITEIYLEEFTSRQARTQHHKFTPTAGLRLPQSGKRKRRTYNHRDTEQE